jgi:hypothetical protein
MRSRCELTQFSSPEGGAELVDHVRVAKRVVEEVLRPCAELNAPVWCRDRPPGVQQDRPIPGIVMFAWPVTVSVGKLKSPGTARTSVMLDACE